PEPWTDARLDPDRVTPGKIPEIPLSRPVQRHELAVDTGAADIAIEGNLGHGLHALRPESTDGAGKVRNGLTGTVADEEFDGLERLRGVERFYPDLDLPAQRVTGGALRCGVVPPRCLFVIVLDDLYTAVRLCRDQYGKRASDA